MSTYSVWAPLAQQVELVFHPSGQKVAGQRREQGWFFFEHPRIAPGQLYSFSIDGGPDRPDPRSQLQPEGVHGPSCWVDVGGFEWNDQGFQQVPLATAVIYELHVGTFTPEGTFESAIERLAELKALGITHVELMPVAHFPGTRGWGYDGVALFAPHTAYGGPVGLQRLVDACHQCGLAVILDVVYNHLGPSGNYLGQYGPYFTNRYQTPWGGALNFDDEESDHVRRFICDNAKYWLRDYHFDALRLDAIHAIYDQSATHILEQLHNEVDALSVHLGRHLVLIAESGLNDTRIVAPPERGGYGLESQWSDDFHHALHSVLTGETSGYYEDFGHLEHLASALRHGFVYRGQYSPFRKRSFGTRTTGVRGRQLVGFIQNHDQVGNRATGDRLSQSLSLGQLHIAAALTLMAPFVPLLFMGEEWGTLCPFQYFVDHQEPELREAVREGRQREFAAFGWTKEQVPDPGAEDTFARSKLDWVERERPGAQLLLRWYTQLLALRRRHPSLADDQLTSSDVRYNEQESWLTLRRGELLVVCNFSAESQEHTVSNQRATSGQILILASETKVKLQESTLSMPAHSVAILEHTV